MSPAEFEDFVATVFAAAGWKDIHQTQPGIDERYGDGGIDILALKNDRQWAIECKHRSSGAVGVDALNQLCASAEERSIGNRILVTNQYFTSEVQVRAIRRNVELFDRNRLQNLWLERSTDTGSKIQPRNYQQSILQDIMLRIGRGEQRFLIEMATGLGKTFTAALLCKEYFKGLNNGTCRVLFLAHQIEILVQSFSSFKSVFGISNYSYGICAGGENCPDTNFVFGSYETLHRQIPSLPEDYFQVVMVDEAHHSAAITYSTVIQHFKPNLRVGLTATPFRMDNQDIFGYFGGLKGHVGKYDLLWAIREKKLAFPKYHVLLDDIDEAELRQIHSGISRPDIDKRLFLHKKDKEVISIVEQGIKESVESPRVIVFCNSIKHIEHLLGFFEPGSATYVHSRMKPQERNGELRAFRDGKFKYILVVDLFNEGIDIPEVNALVFLRATQSRTIWLQQLGRGLRKTRYKDSVHIFDFVGSIERLTEINELAAQVGGRIKRQTDEQPDEDIHDTSMTVDYSKNAADVLNLLEQFQYKNTDRSECVRKLQIFYALAKRLPTFDEIEDCLAGITYNQLGTLFGSYDRFIGEAQVDGDQMIADLNEHIKAWVDSYLKENGTFPLPQTAIHVNSKEGFSQLSFGATRNLLDDLRTSEEAEHLTIVSSVGNDPNVCGNEGAAGVRNALISKYCKSIFSVKDLESLPREEREKIRNVFILDIIFVRQIVAHRKRKK